MEEIYCDESRQDLFYNKNAISNTNKFIAVPPFKDNFPLKNLSLLMKFNIIDNRKTFSRVSFIKPVFLDKSIKY